MTATAPMMVVFLEDDSGGGDVAAATDSAPIVDDDEGIVDDGDNAGAPATSGLVFKALEVNSLTASTAALAI
jgi:hypothetical protein